MEKKSPFIFFALVLLFFIPALNFINFDTASAVVFLLVILYLIVRNRKILVFQQMLHIGKIPLIYAVLWKTKFGIKFMEKFAKKYRELVKLFGYSFVGFGFFGMIFISVNILIMLVRLFIAPKAASEGVALVLPLTNIPGLGFLSFWHFLITIFITVLIHEFAHGIVARAHNVPVKSSGLGIFGIVLPIFPLAFVEPEEKKLVKEQDIVQYSIFAAGPMVNIIFAALILLLTLYVIVPIENNITHPIGFSYNGVAEDFPAQTAGMEPGMIINTVNGVEVLTYQDFSSEIGELRPGEEVTLGTLNGTFTIITKAATDDPERGMIGILDIRNEVRLKERFETYGPVYFWIRGLLKWLYFINLIIGLMNLLPLLVTDGGRMLKLALDKIIVNKKKSAKVWMFIGALFIFTLIGALLVKYGLSFFAFIGMG
ncbi:site-2 protease family protein [Candidatus Woesearchaeota archaeon]|nr:site-2 protease family protein [Candidatus Woesearchaeota archaeon]